MEYGAQISRPTLVVDRGRVHENIRRMRGKAAKSGTAFRPHFKTHQSAVVGEWFREQQVESITVSSVRMARYFADHGFSDITIAFPLNLRELGAVGELASRVRLNLLVLTTEAARALSDEVTAPVGVWIKVDVGYGRTGIPWEDAGGVIDLASLIEKLPRVELEGILTHAGQSYHVAERARRADLFRNTAAGLGKLRDAMREAGIVHCRISVGDTPSTTAVEEFDGVDEVRPGNFVYFDAQQWHLGSCEESQIAAAVACPVVAVHADRGEILLYGGAVHLSAQAEEHPEMSGLKMHGYVVESRSDGWGPIRPGSFVDRVSQEHGVARVEKDMLSRIRPGDLVCVIPVHSCLVVDALDHGITTDGERFDLPL
ncbi:MAG: alanine racemase [Spirochaetaceae bacterium]